MNQDIDKRYQEHQDLYWFTLPQELHPVSLPTSKKIPLKKQLVQSIHQSHNLALFKNTLLHPTRTHSLCRILLHLYKHKPYMLVANNTLNHYTIKNKQLLQFQIKTSDRKGLQLLPYDVKLEQYYLLSRMSLKIHFLASS